MYTMEIWHGMRSETKPYYSYEKVLADFVKHATEKDCDKCLVTYEYRRGRYTIVQQKETVLTYMKEKE